MQNPKSVSTTVSDLFPAPEVNPLRNFFRSHGITLLQLSHATGKSLAAVQQYLNGYRKKPNPILESQLQDIAQQIRKAA